MTSSPRTGDGAVPVPEPVAPDAPLAAPTATEAPAPRSTGAPLHHSSDPLHGREVLRAWLPLAASWLLMGLELPAVSAVMARLPDPARSLAAYGGVVFPLALLIESPVIMLLAASTALSRDAASYRVVRRFMTGLGLAFFSLHALVAFTPLYDVVVARWLHVPGEIVEPARLGIRIMLPWVPSIAFRRTQQGVLIRFGRAREVGIGTAVRLSALGLVLGLGLAVGRVPGIVVGTCAVAAGVVSEALYAGFRVRPVLAGPVRQAPPVSPPLDARRFVRFYLPLMITPLFNFLAMPLASAAMSRLPRAMDSLAAWPVLSGVVFTLRSTGFALNEVVVALLDRPHALAVLRRFTLGLVVVLTGIGIAACLTPLGHAWFAEVSALPPALAALGVIGLALSIPMPGLAALQSLHQGTIVHSHRTRGVTEAMIAFFAIAAVSMVAGGFLLRDLPGIYVATGALVAGNVAQYAWLAWRSRGLGGAAAR
jgi:hypothetical protein